MYNSSMNVDFNLGKGTLLLHLDQPKIPTVIQEYATLQGLSLKESFHITIIGFSAAKEIITEMEKQGLHEEQKEKVFVYLSELAIKTAWKYEIKDDYFHVQKTYPNGKKRESIIVTVELHNYEEYIERLNELFSIKIELFPHITFYAKTSDPAEIPIMGIGIQTPSEFLSLAKKRIVI